MKTPTPSQSHPLQEQIHLNTFQKRFHIMQSPQIINRICEIRHKQYRSKDRERKEFNIESLLKTTRGPSIKKVHDNREKYREIKEKIASSMQKINSEKHTLTLSEIMLWKQNILVNFLQQFLGQISNECKEKSQILVFIWNSVFNIIEYLFEIITKMNEKEERRYLENLLQNHTSYQQIIENLKFKLAKKEDERKQQEEFIQALVYNLRYKRKEIKKLTKNLKMCTVKLNEFKDFYMDLQLEHIELLSENRDISKENALNLLKRKQEINHEKRKEYKLKQSHKKIRFQIESEIDNENKNEEENVNKLNDELKTAFNKFYHDRHKKKKGSSHSITQNIFENALDDFNVRIEQVPETESIIDFKNNIAFMDAMTDMKDFVLDVQDQQMQITFNDRLFEGMICHAAMQTVEIKPKLKIFQEQAVQVNQIDLKGLKLNRVKVIDRSFLLEDYRDKRYKGTTLKIKTEHNLKSMKQIVNIQPKKANNNAEYSEEDKKQTKQSISIQTDDVFLFSCSHIPSNFRNNQFEKEVVNYIEMMNRLSDEKSSNNEEDEDMMSRTSPNFRSKGWIKGKKGQLNLNSTLGFTDESQRSSYISSSDEKRFRSQNNTQRSSSKLSTGRSKMSKNSQYQSSNFIGRSSTRNIKKVSHLKSFDPISETNYEQMNSNDMTSEEYMARYGLSATMQSNNKKFWVNKPQGKEMLSQEKKRFLNDLGRSDQLFSKTGLSWSNDNYFENKKILMDLERMTQQLESNRITFESLQNNINQNINILKEQLRKMLQKKRNNRKLPMSRQQSLCKIISLVYTYAYHLYLNHQKPIQNLIIPLFHYFKIGYGEIKKNDLYLRMLYFLSQTVCHQDEYYIFDTFILFLGLNLNDDAKLKIGKENTCLYLRLLNGLSINFKFPLNVEQLYTTVGYLDRKCRQILKQQRYETNIVDRIVERVKVKLNSLVNSNNENMQNSQSKKYSEIKLNVFKCCQFIMQQIDKTKNIMYDSYLHLYQSFKQEPKMTNQDFINYILKNLYLTKQEERQKRRFITESLRKSTEQNWLLSLCNSFLQINVPDFNKIYFIALSKYKIKQQFLYLSINRRLPFLIKYIERSQTAFAAEHQLIKNILNREEKSVVKEIINKKILALAYLQIVDHQAIQIQADMLGSDLEVLVDWSGDKEAIF